MIFAALAAAIIADAGHRKCLIGSLPNAVAHLVRIPLPVRPQREVELGVLADQIAVVTTPQSAPTQEQPADTMDTSSAVVSIDATATDQMGAITDAEEIAAHTRAPLVQVG